MSILGSITKELAEASHLEASHVFVAIVQWVAYHYGHIVFRHQHSFVVLCVILAFRPRPFWHAGAQLPQLPP